MREHTQYGRLDGLLRGQELRDVPHSVDWADRLAYSHDASYGSIRGAWAGDGIFVPDAVLWPLHAQHVVQVMNAAIAEQINLIPWGGGSGIVGGALAIDGGIVIDFKRMNAILEVDTISQTARVQPGIIMQILEDRLNDIGYTCSHYPQSMHSATLGGAIAHRGAGFKSTAYGKIEDLVIGLKAVIPPGETLDLKAIARNSNGPDLRQLILGSEGAFAFVTEATIRIRKIPEASKWQSFVFENFNKGLEGLRAIMQSGVLPAVVRLFDERETELIFQSEFPDAQGSLLIVLWEGRASAEAMESQLFTDCCEHYATHRLGCQPGEWWWQRRVSTAGLLKTQHQGGFSDTIEVAVPWTRAYEAYRAMISAIRDVTSPESDVFGHVAHAYPTGPDIYMVIHDKRPPRNALVESHEAAIHAAVSAALKAGATLSHHHGIGTLRRAFLEQEYGVAGYRLLARLGSVFDNTGTLNPGKMAKSCPPRGRPHDGDQR